MRSRWTILALVVVAQLMVVLDATIVNIALPSAQADLGFSNGSRQWIVTGYALAFGSLLPLGGRLGDVFGRRRTLVLGSLGFAGASAIGGAAQSFEWLLAARVLQGIVRRPARTVRTRAADDDLHRAARPQQGLRHLRRCRRQRRRGRPPARRRPDRVPVLALVPVREPFLALPVTVGALMLVPRRSCRASPASTCRARATAAGGLFLIVFGFDRAQIAGWTAPETIGLARRWRRAARALRPDRGALPRAAAAAAPARDRARAGSYLAVFFTGIGTFGVFLFVTYYLQQTSASAR